MTSSHMIMHAVEESGGTLIRLEDREMHAAYLVLKAEVYERIRPLLEDGPQQSSRTDEISEGIRRSQEAFFRDLPEILEDESLRGQWVVYHGDQRLEIGPTQTDVIRECNRRGLKDDEYDVFVIRPQLPEPEEVDYPPSWR
jgi:hypothetical protein